MMPLSDFKKKVEKKLKKLDSKNHSIKYLEKDLKKENIMWLILYSMFIIFAFISICIASCISEILVYPAMAAFLGFMVLLLTVFIQKKELYLFLRKSCYMTEKEDFEYLDKDESTK